MKTRPELIIYVDGASSGNPGEAAVGVVIKNDREKKEERISQFIGQATNNFAEYMALLIALERAYALGASSVRIKSDSELLVRQINGQYKVKSENLKAINAKISKLKDRFIFFEIEHVRREFNKDADELAKRAIKEYKRANRMVASQNNCGEESPSSKGRCSG